MTLELGGLHHVSAITGDAPGNYDFYIRGARMRLVKKTVNQDDVSAYHLFYSDKTGRPGTDLTFFDFAGAAPNCPGAGSIETIAFSVVGRAALDWWVHRFDALGFDVLGVAHDPIVERAGRATLPFRDPEGQRLELVAIEGPMAGNLPGEIWPDSPVPAENQIRGLHAVRIAIGRQKQSEFVLTDVLGFRPNVSYALENGDPVQIFEVGPGGSGGVDVVVRNDGTFARPGVGRGASRRLPYANGRDPSRMATARHRRPGCTPPRKIDRFYFRSALFPRAERSAFRNLHRRSRFRDRRTG